MIVVDVIAAGDLKPKDVDTLDIHLDFFGRIARPHDLAAPQQLAVAKDQKLHAGRGLALIRAGNFIINADPGLKLFPDTAEFHIQPRIGMGSHAASKGFAGNHQRFAIDGFIFLNQTPADNGFAQIQLIQPYSLKL